MNLAVLFSGGVDSSVVLAKLKDRQGWVLYPANSIFINGYLTTEGQSADDARRMIEGMGFEVE
jgi:biotin synthase